MGESALGAGSTEQRILRSTVASYVIQLARLAVTFGAKVALMRLILPEGHGVYELALRIVTVASAIRDVGLPYHLVRDPRRPYGTVFLFTAVTGALLTLGLVGIAPLFGQLEPELPAVLRVFAIWVLLDGLAVVPKAFFERELTIGNLVAPEIWRGAVIAIVSVGLALRGWGVWSFVAGDLAGAALLAAYSWWKAWGKVPFKIERDLVPDLLRRSFPLFLIWLTLQLVTYIDAFIVDGFLDTTTVGLYTKAYWLVFLVATLVYPRALFPTLVEYQNDRPRFVEFFRLSTIQLLGLQLLASYFLFFNAERVLLILSKKDEWLPAAPILRVLSFIPFFDQFTILGGEMLKAEHRDREWLLIELLNLVSLVGFGVWLIQRWGAPGMGAANYLLVGNVVMAWEVARVFGPRFKTLLADLAQLYLIPLPFFGLAAWLGPAGSWTRFAASVAAAALAGGALAARYWKPFRRFFAS
ncbi:MAG TPA: oligosaccharide flippase family protein [Thermoanaerobaculia bacterium]|nr:oligosaccharide flippase family protein [Thermoanaerobaculia bacterium]